MEPIMIKTALSFIFGCLTLWTCYVFFKLVTLSVREETHALIVSFGKLVKEIKTPGIHFLPEKLLPWVKVLRCSIQKDFRLFSGIHVNDCQGTTVVIDLWVELKIIEPKKALFNVENVEEAIKALIIHYGTALFSSKSFKEILSDRTELGQMIMDEMKVEMDRWGIELSSILVKKVSLLEEASKQMFETVAAKLERTKSEIEEKGKLSIAELEAKTSVQISSLVAEAKSQHFLYTGRALEVLKRDSEIFNAYQELYKLNLIKPEKTISFRGFTKSGDLNALEALMSVPSPFQ